MFGHSFVEVFLFLAIIVVCMWLDLHAHSKDKPVSARDAAIWSAIWISLAFAFAGYIGWTEGSDKAQLFIAGYLLEESLSVDNLFVMMAIFASFGIRDAYQHRVLRRVRPLDGMENVSVHGQARRKGSGLRLPLGCTLDAEAHPHTPPPARARLLRPR